MVDTLKANAVSRFVHNVQLCRYDTQYWGHGCISGTEIGENRCQFGAGNAHNISYEPPRWLFSGVWSAPDVHVCRMCTRRCAQFMSSVGRIGRNVTRLVGVLP